MRLMRPFIFYCLISYGIITVSLMILIWQDLASSSLLTESHSRNMLIWLRDWLFWQGNYFLFLLILTVVLASVLTGIHVIVHRFRSRP
jgi:hypothetical protein